MPIRIPKQTLPKPIHYKLKTSCHNNNLNKNLTNLNPNSNSYPQTTTTQLNFLNYSTFHPQPQTIVKMGSCNKKCTAVDNAISQVYHVSQASVMSTDKDQLFFKASSPSEAVKTEPNSISWARRGSAVILPNQAENRRGSELNLQRRASGLVKLPTMKRRASASNIVVKTEGDVNLIKTALSKHFIFSNLSESQIEALVKEMQLFVYPVNSVVFEQNSYGEHFFIIARGKVEVIINLKVVAVLNVGDSFGEVALLHETPRTATIVTMQETSLWGLDRVTFRNILQALSVAKYSENIEFVEKIQIFNALTKKQKEALANAMISEKYKPGDWILREGDSGDFMFVILQGTVLVTKNGIELRKLGRGEYFGEQALLLDKVRTASVTALDSVTCISINSSGLKSVLGNHLQEVIHLNTQRMAIENNEILNQLFPQQITSLISKTKVNNYKRGQAIRQAGSLIGGLLIVLRGHIGHKLKKYKIHEIAGVHEVKDYASPLADSLTAIEDSIIAEITKLEFESAIGGSLSDVIEKNMVYKIIKDIGIFRAVDSKTLEKLVKMLNLVAYRPKSYIFTEGSPGDAFFIVKTGSIEVLKEGQLIRIISKFDYFGERSLIFNKTRSASVRAVENVECWTLTKNQFNQIFDESMKKRLLERIELQDTLVNYQDLCPVELLYKGKLSTFVLCANKSTSKTYVLKSVHRNKILAQNMQSSVVAQKKILSQIDHIFIIKLIKTFKDSFRLSFLLEYIPGSDLSTVLETLKKVDELDARFYAGCLVIIFEYLHSHDILYRDLNMKNILVDEQGYLKLIDFSCAKYVVGRTFTIIGTPHFLAPEVINGQGYSYPADLWSLGVMIYFILYGKFPFADHLNDPMEIYQNILNSRLSFPSNVNPLSKSRDFLSLILNKTANLRGKVENLKQHPWFVGLNWDYLITRQIKAPFLPVAKDFVEKVHDSVKAQRRIEEILPNSEGAERYIPKFNSNMRWDAEF